MLTGVRPEAARVLEHKIVRDRRAPDPYQCPRSAGELPALMQLTARLKPREQVLSQASGVARNRLFASVFNGF